MPMSLYTNSSKCALIMKLKLREEQNNFDFCKNRGSSNERDFLSDVSIVHRLPGV